MVEELRVYCIRVITKNVTDSTPLSELTPRDLAEVCADLSPDLPLSLALSLPLTDLYWLRRSRSHYPPPHVKLRERQERARHIGGGRRERIATPITPRVVGGGKKQPPPRPTPTHTTPANTLPPITAVRGEKGEWKKAYLQTHLSRALCFPTQGGRDAWRKLMPLLQAYGGIITSLHLPSIPHPPLQRLNDGGGTDSSNYPDIAQLLPFIPNLKDLRVRYQDVSEGGEYRGKGGVPLHEMTPLASTLTIATPSLTHLTLHESCIDDEGVGKLAEGLRNHPRLTTLDLRHNQISSAAMHHLTSLIKSTPITSINLQHNNIDAEGAEILGAALASSPPPALQSLLLDLNPIRGVGGGAVVCGAGRGGRMRLVSMAGCRLEDACWDAILEALTTKSSLAYLCLAANKFSKDPPQAVVSAAESSGVRILLSNLDGSTYFLGGVTGGRKLPSPLLTLGDRLANPLVPPDPLASYLDPLPPLHGLLLGPQDFTLEEELRGMCLFTKNGKNV